jgi:hypothetical protein
MARTFSAAWKCLGDATNLKMGQNLCMMIQKKGDRPRATTLMKTASLSKV